MRKKLSKTAASDTNCTNENASGVAKHVQGNNNYDNHDDSDNDD